MKKTIKLFKVSRTPYYLVLVVAISLLFLASFNVILSALLQEGLNSAIYRGDIRITGLFAALLLFSCIVYIIFSYVFPVYKEKLYQCISKKLKSRVLQGVLEKPLRDSESISEGDFLTSVVEDCDNCSSYLIQSELPAVQLIVNIIIGFIFVFCQEWKMGVVLLILMPIFYFLNKRSVNEYEEAYEDYLVQEGKQKTIFTEIHKNILLVLAYSLQNVMREKSDNQYEKKLSAAKKQASCVGRMIVLTESGVMCIELIILSLGIALCYIGELKYGTMIAVWNVAVGSIVYPVSELPYILTGIVGQTISFARIEGVINNENKYQSNSDSPKSEALDNPRLIATGIRFRLSHDFRLCANEFECRTGQIVYIVGASGSGKTTFAKILLSLYNPDEGEVIIKDKNKTLKETKNHVVYVPQEKMICKLSLRDNITMGDSSIDDAMIADSMSKTNLLDVIDNYKLESEDNNESRIALSIGQEQRVAISRAYLRESNFVVFDEPFSSLDEANVKIIYELIKEMSKTRGCIVITHNTTMVTKEDAVYQFERGYLYEKQ